MSVVNIFGMRSFLTSPNLKHLNNNKKQFYDILCTVVMLFKKQN